MSESKFAPVVLFVYNRPDLLKETLNALRANTLAAMSDLIVFSDGPKNEEDKPKVLEVRNQIHGITGFRSVELHENDANSGLADSIIAGVTDVVTRFGRIIVLEDDLVTSPYFLQYMNDALNIYENDENVVSIHGYSYPVKTMLPELFFLRGAECWGWATWVRGWSLFEPDGKKLLMCLKDRMLKKEFNYNNSYPYYQMLKMQVHGEVNSWAIRWYASAFLAEKYTLYPGRSLVSHIGYQAGTHFSGGNMEPEPVTDFPVSVSLLPVIKSDVAYNAYAVYLYKLTYLPFHRRILKEIKNLIKIILPSSLLNFYRYKLRGKGL